MSDAHPLVMARCIASPPTNRAVATNQALQRATLALAAVLYAWVLSRGSFDLLGAEPFGLTFNSMLAHMLDGAWDVDPAAIGFEAFVRNGLTYAYFGPFPAILRLPLVILPNWQTLHVERLSCWLAIILGIAAQMSAISATLAKTDRRHLGPPLLLACALSGAPMLLSWRGALIYHEALLWAWALAMVFVALALPLVRMRPQVDPRRLSALALCAGLCLLTRSTTGAGLYLALGLIMLCSRRPRSVWAPSAILAGFIALTGWINDGRWGNPFVFADLRLQTSIIHLFPDRLARLDRYALFDWHRLATGFLYYVLPVWTDGLERLIPLTPRLSDLYDAIERPASSLLLTDPVWCLLAGLGVVTIIRRRARTAEAFLAAGLALAPVSILIAWTMVFRYRVEFAPLLLALSCIALGAPRRRFRSNKALQWTVSLLCIVQIGTAETAGLSYARQPFGPSPGYTALSLSCTLSPASCTPPR